MYKEVVEKMERFCNDDDEENELFCSDNNEDPEDDNDDTIELRTSLSFESGRVGDLANREEDNILFCFRPHRRCFEFLFRMLQQMFDTWACLTGVKRRRKGGVRGWSVRRSRRSE